MSELLAAYALIGQVAELANKKDYPAALELIEKGAREYPHVALPMTSWDKLEAETRARIAPVAPVAAPKAEKPKKAAKKAARKAEKAAAPVAAPKVVEPIVAVPVPVVKPALPTVRIWHRVGEGTRLLDTDQSVGKLCSSIFSRNGSIAAAGGQAWGFHRTEKYWFVRGSGEGCADVAKVNEAKAALEKAGLSVTLDIDDTDPKSGEKAAPAPVAEKRPTKAELGRKARAYAKALDTLCFLIFMGDAQCKGCGRSVDMEQTGAIVKNEDDMPAVDCLACAKVEVSPQNPKWVEEQARMSDEWHAIEDVPAAPKAETPAAPVAEKKPARTRKPAAPKAETPAAPVATPAPVAAAPEVPFIQTVPDSLLFELAMGGDDAAKAEVLRRMSAPVAAPAPVAEKPARRARVVAAPALVATEKPAAQPKVVEKVRAPREAVSRMDIPQAGPIVWHFDLATDASARHTRRELNHMFHANVVTKTYARGEASVGVKVNMDRENGKGSITVTVPERSTKQVDRAKLVSMVAAVAANVRGVVGLALEA